MSRGRRHKKKNFTSNDDGKKGNKRTKKTTGGEANKNNNANGVMVSERRSTRGHPAVNNTNEKVPRELASYLEAGPSEAQSNRLMNPGRCSIRGCKLTTTIPVKCDTTYDSTMNETDKCKHVCHYECAKEADLISDFNDECLYCSKKCKTKGDKYRDEELQNATPKGKGNITKKKTTTHRVGVSHHRDDEPFIQSLSQDSSTVAGDDADSTGGYEPNSSTTTRQTKGTKTRTNSNNKNNNKSTDYAELIANGEFPVSLRIGWKKLERANGTVTAPQKDNEYIHFLKSELTTSSSFEEVKVVVEGRLPAGKQLFEKNGHSFYYNHREQSVDPGVTSGMKEEKDTCYKLTSTISDDEDYYDAIGTSGLKLVTSELPDDSPVTTDAACEDVTDEMDEDDDNNESPLVFHLDLVVLVCDKRADGGKSPTIAKRVTHSVVQCNVLNVTMKVVGNNDGDIKYMTSPKNDSVIGSFTVKREDFCTSIKYGNLRQSMLKVYADNQQEDFIGKHSSIFIKYDNRGSNMLRVTSSEDLLQQYKQILAKQTSKASNGMFTIQLSLGKKKKDDAVLEYLPTATQLNKSESQQIGGYQSPLKETATSRAARRHDSRVLGEDNDTILDLFHQVKELDAYKNKIAREHKAVFILHCSDDASERERIASDLEAGVTPKLLFMRTAKYARMLHLIKPGDIDFGTPLEGDEEELPSILEYNTRKKGDDDPLNKVASSIQSLVESKKAATAPPKATAIRFIKYGEGMNDSFRPGDDEIHQVTVLDSAVNGVTGMALLLAASNQAQLDGSLVFSVTNITSKSYNRYKFRGLNPASDQFKSMSLETILTGTAGTLEIIVSHHKKKDIVSENVLI